MSTENNKPSVGIRTWGDVPKNKNRQFNDDVPRLPFMRLQQGINNLRIITDVGVYYHVRWKGPKSTRKFGDRIRTAYPTYDAECPIKNIMGLEPKERYMVIVIDRSDNELKVLDMGQLTHEQINTNLEVKNSIRKDGTKITPRDFDISIKFDPKSDTPNGFYSVVVHDSIPMSTEDFDLINDIGGQEVLDKILNRQILCPKPETVRKRLEDLGWDGEAVKKKSDKVENTNSKSVLSEPEEEDYSFNRVSTEESETVASEETVASDSVPF